MNQFFVKPSLFKKVSIILFLFITSFSARLSAQVKMYTFSSTTGNTLVTGGVFTSLLGSFLDDDVSATANIGFTFNYGGTNYTTFSVTSNGLLAFGGSAITDYNNVTGNLSGAYLAPYWDDNYTDANGFVNYKLTGTVGSRILVVDYFLSYLGNTGAADKRFQIWLFETSNKIMFVYGSGNNFNGGFSIAATTNGLSDFISISSATNSSNISTAQDNNTAWPGSGRAYILNGSSTLPVTLTNFSASCKGSYSLLEWTTSNEQNNSHFIIERSANAQTWHTIAEVKGAGSSIIEHKYTYKDELSDVKQYYRLRQVDYSGAETISSVVTVQCRSTSVSVVRVYPNPVHTIMQVTGISKKTTYRLVNTYGQVVKQGVLTPSSAAVNVTALTPGLYYLKLQDPQEQIRFLIEPSR